MSSYPHLLSGEEEDFSRRHSGWSLSTPSLLPHTPPSPFLYWKRNSGSKVRHAPACPHTHNTQLSLRDGTEQQGHKLGHGGLLLSLPAKTQDAHVEKCRHVHTLALEAGDEGRDGLGPSPGGIRKQFRRPWVEEEGPVHLVTDVDFAQIKKQIRNSSRFLTVRWRLSVVYEMVQNTQAEYLDV